MLRRLARGLLRELPAASNAATARRLIARADAARDARQWGIAAALYLEALRFNPDNPRVRIQCGHMLKESGDLAGAGEQYERARLDLPQDADLALQIGHLHKLAGRPEEAEASYAKALALRPGWREAERELAAVSVGGPEIDAVAADWAIPELLPRGDNMTPSVERDILRLFRLGGRRAHSRWGDLKQLRGIEAIRGYRLAPPGLAEIRLVIDRETVRREPLQIHQMPGGRQIKYVFNLWHDFSQVTPGRHVVELGFHDASGHRRNQHRETILVAPPVAEENFPASDALVPPGSAPVEEWVNALPSMIRTVDRQLLPKPIRSIMVQRVDQMGDLVCSVPAIRRLRELFSGARLTGLVTPANAPLAEALRLFDEIIEVNFREDPAERRRVLALEAQDQLRRTLAQHDFDIAIDLGEGDESRALLLLSGAKFLYGFKDRQSPWLDAGLDFNAHDPVNGIEIIPPSRKIGLLVEGLAAMAQDNARPIPNPERTALAEFGLAVGDRYAVIHAGARLAYSRWPHFASLVEMLLERTDLKIMLLADEAETIVRAADQAGHSARLRLIEGQLPFPFFDALLSHCAVFVGNDSGPKHLAALRGAPVVSIHMARLNWSEWGQEISGRIISRRVPCAGCGIGLDGEDCGQDFACLRYIRAEEVYAAIEDLLAGGGGAVDLAPGRPHASRARGEK